MSVVGGGGVRHGAVQAEVNNNSGGGGPHLCLCLAWPAGPCVAAARGGTPFFYCEPSVCLKRGGSFASVGEGGVKRATV